MNGATDFYRGWIDYKNGFGSLTSELWLDFEGNLAYAEYFDFSLGDSASNFRLNVKGYCGTAGDSLAYHNGMMFSTKDKDNDKLPFSCAKTCKGAWWSKACNQADLNGEYLGRQHTYDLRGIKWRAWKGDYYSLKSTKMMIKRN
ncbi:microfibril-associated glycoprotein 4-like [Mytilus californianus]|uniref:microfibril-associated glycoprotein 4-like n=1 Tax=Mytilus californianus TaxID=6549 RepID=UPI0022462DBD|nr:microfibril-associated glycoprotein 4-like [Mytilus californianus]